MKSRYDIVVIGAGHAGAEAAFVAVRAGARTAMVTLSVDKIGEMSCNPAIGGLAKGQIVCEIDALGGLMGEAADATGIQFRMLNRSAGPAVWGPRAQSDKRRYARYIRTRLESLDGLTIIEGEATDILTADGKVVGVQLADGQILQTRVAIVTGGTFLNGVIHIGDRQYSAGRIGEKSADRLTDSLRRLGLRVGRLKTGTCPRLLRDTIDWDRCHLQPGDDIPTPFSMLTEKIAREQTPCHMTYTNSETHRIIRDNLDRMPLYSGQITSTGPRYCPSIEIKVLRFGDKDRHQVYLEPESLEDDWIYCNGLSTSIPEDLQEAIVHSIVGLEKAKIAQYGYAIEYDFIFPDQLGPDLQTRSVEGLFLAGQINGTSGYEEAASQGLMAGINGVGLLKGADPVVLGRDQAYIGVMIDDLVTRGIDEPYRMFTSRAEFRLMLRADTAERRLCPIAEQLGLLDEKRRQKHLEWDRQRQTLLSLLGKKKVGGVTAEEWLRRPENGWDALRARLSEDSFAPFDSRVCHQVHADIKYSGYLHREQKAAAKLHQLEVVRLSPSLDYTRVPGLKFESKEKLNAVKPINLGQASRISGITPADIMVLMIFLKQSGRSQP